MDKRRRINRYPLPQSDMLRYRSKARGMSSFERHCALMGIDPRSFGFQPVASMEAADYHNPMDFLGKDEQPPTPRREFSGTNTDE